MEWAQAMSMVTAEPTCSRPRVGSRRRLIRRTMRGPGTLNGRRERPAFRCCAHDVDGDGLSDVVYGMGHDYGLFWFRQGKSASGEPHLDQGDYR